MTLYSLKHPEIFEVPNAESDKYCFGCDQNWYSSEWQRISGCGPTAASNIIYYFSRSKPQACNIDIPNNKAGRLALMEKVWSYVTPTEEGVDTSIKFSEALSRFFNAIGVTTIAEICDVPENKEERLELNEVLKFLIRALENDVPVAFLNLCNGEEPNFESWHWVTVIALEYENINEHIYLKILDESQIKKINLTLWYNTTALGGGFVYFSILNE